jgi:hypothetical protein
LLIAIIRAIELIAASQLGSAQVVDEIMTSSPPPPAAPPCTFVLQYRAASQNCPLYLVTNQFRCGSSCDLEFTLALI